MTSLLLKGEIITRCNNSVKNCCITSGLSTLINHYQKFQPVSKLPISKQYVSGDAVIADTEIANKDSDAFAEILKYYKDRRILYNCLLEKHKLNLPHYLEKKVRNQVASTRKRKLYNASIPLIVEKLKSLEGTTRELDNINKNDKDKLDTEPEPNLDQFPFARFENVKLDELPDFKPKIEEDTGPLILNQPSIKEDIEVRLQAYNENVEKGVKFSQITEQKDKELEVRIYEDTLLSELDQYNEEESVPEFYGTPKPDIPKSSVPCGGCGAFLHCQDEGLPGYTPSEVFCKRNKAELRAVLCQRCIFLQNHNAALNVRVAPSVYEKALQPIVQSYSLILVVVDLLDAPCSVWPGLYELIGSKRPVVVVGNKVDLLPLDNKKYLITIKESLVNAIKTTSLWRTNIQHICLTSAKTGYGVEDLISHLQVKWGVKGDIYIVGCTNAGKSTLFNALLGSDLCQVAASSLIRRATSSPWPGTTLNLLKFPLLRPSGKLLFDRSRRLLEDKRKAEAEALNQADKKINLKGHVGKTFLNLVGVQEAFDPFRIATDRVPRDSAPVMGINETSRKYINSKWCYDTPGTVQPDQFLGLLTHDELVDVLPTNPITPRIFSLKSSQSLLLGGVARLDLLYCSSGRITVTVCCSAALPVTIVLTSEAANLYRFYLGTDLLRVPRGTADRLSRWPALMPTNLRLSGRGKDSAGDVVLSSAGFISITGALEDDLELRGWTPGGRGVHVRAISMLPHSENMRGKRKKGSPMYYVRNVSVN